MVGSRAAFLERGHYGRIAEAVVAAASEAPSPQAVAEVGCGTGYYLGRVGRALGDAAGLRVLGLDLSKAAATHAARAVPEALICVADVQERIPVVDGGLDLLVSVFAPRPAREAARIVRAGGLFVAAFAADDHLAATRERLGLLEVRPRKLAELRERLAPHFELADVEHVHYEIALTGPEIADLVGMGPNARHAPPPGTLPEGTSDRVSVLVARFARHGTAASD